MSPLRNPRVAGRTIRPAASPAGRRPSCRKPGQQLHRGQAGRAVRRARCLLSPAGRRRARQRTGDRQRLQDLRSATLDLARDDSERAALGPRLDAHLDDAMDGIGRHVDAQRLVFQRNTLGTRQALIQRAAALEHDNDGKIAGLAEANASAARERARLDGVAPGSDAEADVLNAARSQILRTAIEQRIANARGAQAIDLHDRMADALTPADRRALELPIAAARDDTATDAWLTRQAGIDGPPLADRVASDDGLTDTQRLILRAKIGAQDSAAESHRVAAVKGLDDQLAAATKAIATQPSQYRIGTLNALAQAYADAGEPDKAADTRRLAAAEPLLLPFAQTDVATQQRRLDDFTGPERTMAEAIMSHQADAFAKDPYAAGTALYPDVGPGLPAEDAEGRLKQARMIEAKRGTPDLPQPNEPDVGDDRQRLSSSEKQSPSADELPPDVLDALPPLDQQVAKTDDYLTSIRQDLGTADAGSPSNNPADQLAQADDTVTPRGFTYEWAPPTLDPKKLNRRMPEAEQQQIANVLGKLVRREFSGLRLKPYENYPDPVTGAVLPPSDQGYLEIDVPNSDLDRGSTRLLIDKATGRMYYKNTHYRSFYPIRLNPKAN